MSLAHLVMASLDAEGCQINSLPVTLVGTVASASFASDTVLTGQFGVVTAGTAVQGPDTEGASRVAVKGHQDNAGAVYWGNDGAGDVTSANGWPLSPGQAIVLKGNLDQYWFDADNSGDVVCWGIVE